MAKTETSQGLMEKINKWLHEDNFFTKILAKLEATLGVDRFKLFAAVVAFQAIWLVAGWGREFLSNFTGIAFPAYRSVQAIESPDKADDIKWLTYWVVFAFVTLLESAADIFLWWIPFYNLSKTIFLIYCFAPTKWNGSEKIYNTIIKPFVTKHEKKIDAALDKAKTKVEDVKKGGAAAVENIAAEGLRQRATGGSTDTEAKKPPAEPAAKSPVKLAEGTEPPAEPAKEPKVAELQLDPLK